MQIKFTKEQAEFFNDLNTQYVIDGGDTYMFSPFWFKETEDKLVFEMLTFDQLPKDLIEFLKLCQEENK